jgi:hypothetical protein
MSPTEGWVRINAQDAWQVVITGIRASRGVGVARIAVDLDVRTRSDTLVERPLWLSGALHIHSPGLATSYLCELVATPHPTAVPELARAATLSLDGTLSLRQLKIIEAARTDRVELEVELRGHAVVGERFVPFWAIRIDQTVQQSTWIDYLGAWGYRNVLLLEVDQPSTARTPELRRATQYLVEAQDQFLQHKARPAVESLRQCLVTLVGETTPSDTSEADVDAALRSAQRAARDKSAATVGYDRRLDLIRLALKFATDLAAHPEEAETTHADAEALFIMTAGLIQRLGKGDLGTQSSTSS